MSAIHAVAVLCLQEQWLEDAGDEELFAPWMQVNIIFNMNKPQSLD